MSDPIALNTASPAFSWVPTHTDRGSVSTAYQVQVNSTLTGATVWDSGKVTSASTVAVVYGGSPLDSDASYTWAVTWWDGQGQQAPWSAPASFGTGWLDATAWATAGSQWIGCPAQGSTNLTDGMNQLRAEFTLTPPSSGATVTQARLYVSGLGWHIAYLNGQRLGTAVLEPAFTTLPQRVLYATHDVTGLVTIASGATNVFAAFLGRGWPDVYAPWSDGGNGIPYWNGSTAGEVSSPADPFWREKLMDVTDEDILAMKERVKERRLGHAHTGYQRRLRLVLSVRWSDGTNSAFVSSATGMGATKGSTAAATWMCGAGALLNDDLYGGCTYDARAETVGWFASGYTFNTGTWAPAVRIADPGGAMVATDFPQVEVVNELEPRAMWESTPGTYVFDFAQNFAGIVRMVLPAPTTAGVTISIRHAESVLHPPYGPQNGSLYYGNLRTAEATDTYTTAGVTTGAEVFVPMFTWHGFRYIEVSGLPFVPSLTGIFTGLNIRSAVEPAGNIAFPASANVLNQLQHAIVWGQASNLMGNPSDCPQRDERLGWTGDSALSSEETSFNFDSAAFLTHWAATLNDATINTVDPTWPGSVGGIPAVVPDVIGGYNQDSAWMSVYPTTIHTIWRSTGDTRVVKQYWPNLLGFVNITTSKFNGDIAKIFNTWGDWCPPPAVLGGGQGPKPVAAYTAGLAFLDNLQQIIEMGQAIGDNGNVTSLLALQTQLIADFNAAWFKGTYYGNSPTDGAQTAQAAALGVGVVPANLTSTIVSYLVDDIANNHAGHLSVGIFGQKYLTRVLTATGNAWLAANISLQTDYPSFGWAFNHPVEPATTLWELWDGPTEGPGMNSRNHIMQGAIGVWLYRDVAGIEQAEGSAGWSSIVIAPKVTVHEAVPSAAGWHNSIRGTIDVSWTNATTTSFLLDTTIPVNTQAEVRIPFAAGGSPSALVATEGGLTFFSGGAYKPGAVPGVTGAAVNTQGNYLSVMVGSGSYNFALNW
jgi:alpha-L-rhamnosidase